jgi:hypothetical protein
MIDKFLKKNFLLVVSTIFFIVCMYTLYVTTSYRNIKKEEEEITKEAIPRFKKYSFKTIVDNPDILSSDLIIPTNDIQTKEENVESSIQQAIYQSIVSTPKMPTNTQIQTVKNKLNYIIPSFVTNTIQKYLPTLQQLNPIRLKQFILNTTNQPIFQSKFRNYFTKLNNQILNYTTPLLTTNVNQTPTILTTSTLLTQSSNQILQQQSNFIINNLEDILTYFDVILLLLSNSELQNEELFYSFQFLLQMFLYLYITQSDLDNKQDVNEDVNIELIDDDDEDDVFEDVRELVEYFRYH